MPKFADCPIITTTSSFFNGAGTNYLIETPSRVLYLVFIDINADVSFVKSTDGGFSWSDFTVVFAGSTTNLAVWYDRWSNISAGLIHCAYTESGGDDTLYRTIDTESSDALSTQTTIFAGGTTAGGGQLTIARARGGNVYCRTCIDAGAEGGFFRLPNANVPNGAWDAALTTDEALATTDQMILLPGWAADNQDMMAFFWDASANEVSRKLYDDSANTWGETSISGSMTDVVATTTFPHFAAAVDITNSQNILIAWNGVDTANADLLCWKVTESAITAVTDVVTNSTDDQGCAALSIDTNTGYWYAFYGGKSDGSETWSTSIKLYYKVSQDSGATWGAETEMTSNLRSRHGMFACPRFVSTPKVLSYVATIGAIYLTMPVAVPRASYQLGL